MSLTHKIASTGMLIDLIATIPFQHADRNPTRRSAAATDAKDFLGRGPKSSRSNDSSAPLGDLCALAVKNSSSSMASPGLPRHRATTPGIDFDFGKEPPDTFTRDQHPDRSLPRQSETTLGRIPNGSWCLFREPSDGSRNGKVVIVQSRDIQDPDTGGQCTVKIYRSEKTETEDSWSHRSIQLEPDTMDFSFKPLILESNTVNDLRVIGEFLAIIS